MAESLRIALAQVNLTVGDIAANQQKIRQYWQDAAAQGVDLVVFPEMAVTGYPVEDLALRPGFRHLAMQAVEALADFSATLQTDALIAGLWEVDGKPVNAAFLLSGGKIIHQQIKHHLPNHGVFDEQRIFVNGPLPKAFPWRGIPLGVLICEDLWQPEAPAHLAQSGAALVISINASPYEQTKAARRRKLAEGFTTQYGIPLLYLNLIGGQDELVFDGGSFAMHADGSTTVSAPSFTEALIMTEWQSRDGEWQCAAVLPANIAPDDDSRLYQAMMLGLRDYVHKSGFRAVLLGLSGGIDSALTAAVAVDALGRENVHSVMLPSPFTSQESLDDAAACAELLGISLDTIPIAPAMQAMDAALAPLFAGKPKDLTEENIQARLRGNILMALSNKMGWMLLTTGNKSEMAVGYATLYGDMCGGYSVLKDLYKTEVFRLSHWRNSHLPPQAKGPDGPVMPERVITKPPTAELRENQTDQDSLPPYDILDAILYHLIERQESASDIIALGHDAATVERVAGMLKRAEYKRFQAPPGVKLSTRSFGRDWRYPLVNGYKL